MAGVEGHRERVIPEGWVRIATLPATKYVVVQTDTGWDVYSALYSGHT